MDTYSEYLFWIFILDTYYEYLFWMFILDTYSEYLLWIPILDIFSGYLLKTPILDAYSGYLLWIPILNTYSEYLLWIPIPDTYDEYLFWMWSVRRIGRVDAFRPLGYGFDSRSIRHVGTLGKSFTHSCLWRSGVKLRYSIRAVVGTPRSSSGLEEAL